MFEIEILRCYHSKIWRHVHGVYACEFFRCHFGWKAFVIHSLYKTFKEKLKIQGHHPFKLGSGVTSTCIMIVYENVMISGTNKNRKGGQNNWFLGILPVYSLMYFIMPK